MSVSVGDVFEQASAAPGFAPMRFVVERKAERPGWWWCEGIVRRRIPERALLNPRVYRRLG